MWYRIGQGFVVCFAVFAVWEIHASNKADQVPNSQDMIGKGEGYVREVNGHEAHGMSHCDDHELAVTTFFPATPRGIKKIRTDCSPTRDRHHHVIFAPCDDGRMPEITEYPPGTYGTYEFNCNFKRHPISGQPPGDNESRA